MTSSDSPSTSRRRTLGSAAWATGQQVVLLGCNAVYGIALARTLSVADFGVFSYVTSLASVGLAIVSGGLGGLAIKALLDDRGAQAHTMSALIAIREAFALLAFVVLVALAFVTGGELVGEATALGLLVLFARAWDGVEFWFQANVDSRKSASVRIGVALVMLAVRIGLAVAGAGLWVFLALYVVESVIMSGGLVLRYLAERGSPGLSRPRLAGARGLLASSWLLMLSAVANQVNVRAGTIVLQAVSGSAAVGTYAAAARLAELPFFLPAVFMTATFPALLEVRRNAGDESAAYRAMLQRSYDRACWVGFGIAAVVFAAGPAVLTLLYGERYSAAGAVLRILVLALPFVFMAAVLSKWLIAEHLLRASLVRHGGAAVANVLLCLLLVPEYGMEGAAAATAFSYVLASYLSCFAGRSTWPAGRQMTLALVYPVRLARRRVRRAR